LWRNVEYTLSNLATELFASDPYLRYA